MTPQLRPTIWLERDGSPIDEMKEGVERMVNICCSNPAQQIALCRVAVCRQLQRIQRHALRFRINRRFKQNTEVQLALWQLAHKQLTGSIFTPDDDDIEDLAEKWNQMLGGTP